jgi:hypothetical protein
MELEMIIANIFAGKSGLPLLRRFNLSRKLWTRVET